MDYKFKLANLPDNLPKISIVDYNGDLSRSWYLDLTYRHAITGEVRRSKYSRGISQFTTLASRYAYCNKLIGELKRLLSKGVVWDSKAIDPFEESKKNFHNLTFVEAIEQTSKEKEKQKGPDQQLMHIWPWLHMLKSLNWAESQF